MRIKVATGVVERDGLSAQRVLGPSAQPTPHPAAHPASPPAPSPTPLTEEALEACETIPSHERLRGERIARTVMDAMAGTLPRGRPLKPWEPERLSPLHIQMVMLRAEGKSNPEILAALNAQGIESSLSRIGCVLASPNAQTVLGEILSVSADRIADPLMRIQGVAHEMINIQLEIARNPSVKDELRSQIASDFLDRAGYGARRQSDVAVAHTITIPASAANQLAAALHASRRVSELQYSDHLVLPPTDRVTSLQLLEGERASQPLTPSLGQMEVLAGTSPDALPTTPTLSAEEELSLAEERLLQMPRKRRTA